VCRASVCTCSVSDRLGGFLREFIGL
jgi:hypothetical protein